MSKDQQHTMALTVEPLSLDNIGEGLLKQQFEDAMAELAACFSPQDPYPFETKGGRVKGKVILEIELEHDTERNLTSVDARVELKRPKLKRVRRPAMLRNGMFLTEPTGDQLAMFGDRRVSMRTEGGGE